MRATSHPNFGLIDGIPAQQMLDATRQLDEVSENLRKDIETFLADVQAV